MSASDTEAAAKPLEANELPIVKIFSSDYAFEIPPYRRPYSWTEKEAGKLLEDPMEAVGDVREVQEAPSYFLGSIVLIKGQGSPSADPFRCALMSNLPLQAPPMISLGSL